MFSLFIFFSVYFTVPNNDISEVFKTKCENNKEYILYHKYVEQGNSYHQEIMDKDSNIVFDGSMSNREGSQINDFYCIDNELYLLLGESDLDGIPFIELNIYKLDDGLFIKQDSLTTVAGEYPMINGRELIYKRYSNGSFYKNSFGKVFGDEEEFINSPNYLSSQKSFYFKDIDSIIYVDKNNEKLYIQDINDRRIIFNLVVKNLYDVIKLNNKFYFLIEDTNNNIKIIDREGNLYHEYTLAQGKDIKKGFLVVNEYGIYAFILSKDKELKVLSVPNFDSSEKLVKDAYSNISDIDKDDDGYFYLKNTNTSTEVNTINGECTIPDSPILGDEIIGVLSTRPSSLTLSNFNEDLICFNSYHLEISTKEDFNSVVYGDTVTYYNVNSSVQTYLFYSNFTFDENKAYYIMIKYNGVLASSLYTYIRLIITDLGEITNFEILDVTSNSKLYTNNDMVNAKIEKLGFMDKIQLSLNENFKDENDEDILALDFKSEFSFLLPPEEKEYTYYVRPVALDDFNNNIMGGHQISSAKIILDKTPPEIVAIKPINEDFFSDNIKIKWEFSEDNLSGVKNYKIRVVDSLNNAKEEIILENIKNYYSPSVSLEKGIYTFFISSCDNAENCSTESKINFTVTIKENLKPYKPSLIRPLNRDIIETMPINISWTKSEDPENDDVSYSLVIAKDKDFSKIEFEANLINNLSKDITYLSEGKYFLKLFAVDASGNKSDNEIIEFDVIEPSSKSSNGGSCSF